ncbi:type I-C CRISPR-associated protein Cas8c/Csd1 [Dokdonella koreensis]|uniref:CRISPR-associated protein, Csd1 family n=1 Tax=Dokdonella koreensis DS-123 TaxID=1300342 RepID=A0A160DVC2_9GAMM|nr:type I-C CRISPR-associated protein Cas8c/Csd1 [Dokdonella koreensis]ANB18488.1 CRISPR-associated protein, Csd1 family [Dokdonella koreensis DS-123]
MNWLGSLYETYQACYGRPREDSAVLMPIAHTTQQAHIEIVLDAAGRFRRAEVLNKGHGTTLIPCTEASGGRAGSKPTSHPLSDKLQYVAADFVKHGGDVTSGFSADPGEPHRVYLELLSGWAASSHGHPKLDAVLHYVRKGHVVSDLVTHGVLPVDEDGKLVKAWPSSKDQAPAIYKSLPPGQVPEDAFIRWSVEGDGLATGTWQDATLMDAWIAYYGKIQTLHGYCMVRGENTTLAVQHPAKLRNAGDKAKLISSNDDTGFTYRGRFTDAEQVVGVGYETTQKAHNALRWLIERQGSRSGDQAIVSWTVVGTPIPNPVSDEDDEFSYAGLVTDVSAGQVFARKLKQTIEGYRHVLKPSQDVHVIALDSATPGRMSITFYRRLRGSEFLDRLHRWHERFAWQQNYGRERQFVGAPLPRDIAQAAYGRRLDPKLEAATRERLLSCIVDQMPCPPDLAKSAFKRAVNRSGLDKWDWEKCLGVACALHKGIHTKEDYTMALEPDRTTRDYLYGRLLALAESLESYALDLVEEKRDTSAARLMHRFSTNPFSTWNQLEARFLPPYKTRLRSRRPEFLAAREKQLDEVHVAFRHEDFVSDAPLSGEFLLGYHCQRAALRQKKTSASDDPPAEPAID